MRGTTVIRSVTSPAWVIELVRRNWHFEATDAQLTRSLVNDVWSGGRRVRAQGPPSGAGGPPGRSPENRPGR